MEFIKKIIKALTPVSQEELDHQYLNEATSVHDLEWRIRQIDRDRFSQSKSFPTHHGSY